MGRSWDSRLSPVELLREFPQDCPESLPGTRSRRSFGTCPRCSWWELGSVLHRPTSLLQHRVDLSDSLQSATQTGPGQCQQ